MKIDAHQHFWRYDPGEYGWIGPEMGVLRADFLPGDLGPLLERSGFGGSVAVQARQTLEETRWLLALADRFPFVRGVVGWVDLRGAGLQEELERLSAHPRFRGVRHVLQDEEDDRFMLGEDFVQGIAALEDFGLTYDLLIFPRHLAVAVELVKRFPQQRFVVDHLAKPDIKAGQVAGWAKDMECLAALPNVWCKVSGMVTEADWGRWRPEDMQPYLDVVFEAFGAQRIMFGSDWPVCTVAGTYAQVAGIVDTYVAALSEDEQAAVWGETARAFYGLG